MPFVQAGEAHAEQPGGKHQPPAPQTVYIQGEGYGDGKQEIFRHMRQLAYIMFNPFRIMRDLRIAPSPVQGPVTHLNLTLTVLLTELEAVPSWAEKLNITNIIISAGRKDSGFKT